MEGLPSALLDLDSVRMDSIETCLMYATEIQRQERDVSSVMRGMLLCPIFLQDSSRTYINSVASFIRMGGNVLPLNIAQTRFGSKWAEPLQDFACLISACCDNTIARTPTVSQVRELASSVTVPLINAGNGAGTGAEHPMQALIDLYTIRHEYRDRPLRILMIGGLHIRSTRSQIKLFVRAGHDVAVLSPPSPVPNSDIEGFVLDHCETVEQLSAALLRSVDLIYHNGVDENPDIVAGKDYLLTRSMLEEYDFRGKIMHSLPRKMNWRRVWILHLLIFILTK